MKNQNGRKVDYLTKCAANIILQIPEDQDHILQEYSLEIGSSVLNYITKTSKENLEMIYENKFKFQLIVHSPKVFRFKFEYFQ